MVSGRITNCPLHPALVHFPIGAWTLALIGDGVYLFNREPLWWQLAYWAIAAGVATGLPAMAAGLFEITAIEDKHPAWPMATRHTTMMSGAWLVFTIDLLLRDPVAPGQVVALWLPVILSILGMILMVTGGHAGARLVYRYGVGVNGNSEQK
ncbi:MAG: DUF2231 domain-containing protein [Gammaproteobacteria bacterium]